MIKVSVEGPKLVGKSTLLKQIFEEDKKNFIEAGLPSEQFKMKLEEWKYNHYLTIEEMMKQAGSNWHYYYDRGILTNIVFSVIGDNFGHIVEDKITGQLTVNMFNLSHLDNLVANTERYIVLFAKDEETLRFLANRKKIRDKKENRNTANEYEINTLFDQNELYKAYGRIMKKRHPDNVELIEVDSFGNQHEFKENTKVELTMEEL